MPFHFIITAAVLAVIISFIWLAGEVLLAKDDPYDREYCDRVQRRLELGDEEFDFDDLEWFK